MAMTGGHAEGVVRVGVLLAISQGLRRSDKGSHSSAFVSSRGTAVEIKPVWSLTTVDRRTLCRVDGRVSERSALALGISVSVSSLGSAKRHTAIIAAIVAGRGLEMRPAIVRR